MHVGRGVQGGAVHVMRRKSECGGVEMQGMVACSREHGDNYIEHLGREGERGGCGLGTRGCGDGSRWGHGLGTRDFCE